MVVAHPLLMAPNDDNNEKSQDSPLVYNFKAAVVLTPFAALLAYGALHIFDPECDNTATLRAHFTDPAHIEILKEENSKRLGPEPYRYLDAGTLPNGKACTLVFTDP